MISLSGLALPDGLLWDEAFATPKVAQVVKRTLGGRNVVYAAPLQGGMNITLRAMPDQGWLTLAQGQALQAMAELPNEVFVLTMGSSTYNVLFRNHDAPAVELSPLVPRTPAVVGDYFIGLIKLMTV